MSNATDAFDEVTKSLNKAAEDDNTLDRTVFYSCRATTYAVTAVLACIMEIKDELREIKAHINR